MSISIRLGNLVKPIIDFSGNVGAQSLLFSMTFQLP